MPKVIAVIDDDGAVRELLGNTVRAEGYDVVLGQNGKDAVELASTTQPDLYIIDVRMPEMDGISALKGIFDNHPEAKVILVTAFIDLKDAIGAIKTGALDYIEKPIDLEELCSLIDDYIGRVENPGGEEDLDLPEWIVAESAEMRRLLHDVRKVAATNATVLLSGESGTGKEIIADLIVHLSERRGKPLIKVNCASLPHHLIESELFGCMRGAFTGADRDRQGQFEAADGGTLMLDEISELPIALQPKLLRVLENRIIRRLGSVKETPFDARIIAATNKSLDAEVKAGTFREDLLYRLNVFAIEVPPLRDYKDDIAGLAKYFLAKLGASKYSISPAAVRVLMAYNWPGNIRELRNVVERAVILSPGKLIMPEHLPDKLRKLKLQDDANALSQGSLDDMRRKLILDTLEECAGNKTATAKKLGISRRTLIYRLREYGL